jgi:hypothetical protein
VTPPARTAPAATCWPATPARPTAADDAPTERLPPIGSTVRRRPPVPNVRELQGPELLRALADELDRDGYTTDDL